MVDKYHHEAESDLARLLRLVLLSFCNQLQDLAIGKRRSNGAARDPFEKNVTEITDSVQSTAQ